LQLAPLIDESGLLAGLYHKLLVKACKVRKFLEAEIKVDAFHYRCTSHRNKINLEAPFPELEMSIRLGFIQNEQAHLRLRIAQAAAIDQGQLSLYKAADQFYEQYGDRIAVLVEEPLSRYVFALPDALPLRSFFNHDGLLVEEDLYLKEILDAELVTPKELQAFEFEGGVSVYDLLKAFRIFGFVSHVAKRCPLSILEADPVLAYRSLVPVFSNDQLTQFLGWGYKHCRGHVVVDVGRECDGRPPVSADLERRKILFDSAEHRRCY